MKNTATKQSVGIFVLTLLCVGLFSAQSAQAYNTNQYQYQQQHQSQFNDGRYQYQVYSAPIQNQYYDQRLQQLLLQIAQLQALLLQLQENSGVVTPNYNYDDSEVSLSTRSASSIGDDSATLRGEVTDFNRSDYADVWFEYGRATNDLDKRTPIFRIDENDDEDFSIRIGGLRDDTRYYFRAVGEDDDEEKAYGSILNFQTDDGGRNNNSSYGDDQPDVSTRGAFDIDRNSARVEGTVDMNDFRNGEVFFVYGEDENQIEDVANDYDSYSDVDEDRDDLRKFSLDRNLDGKLTYEIRMSGLDDNTDYYYSLCVGYEDEDNDDVLECSSTRDFQTD